MHSAELPIASPCNADWTTMTLAEKGRFCGACKKVVRELTQLSEPEARALLASPPTEGLCVRYVSDATGEILFRRDFVPMGRLASVAKAAARAIVAASLPMAVAGCMGAAPMPPAPPPPPPMMGVVTMGEPPAPPPPAPSAKVATDPSDVQSPPAR